MMFLEILDRRRRVRSRVRLEHFPVLVGRAYTSDVILDDRFVCPQHLRILCDQQGELVVEDLESVNGVYRLDPTERVARARVESGTLIRVGHTELRFRSADHPVAPAAVLGRDRGSLRRAVTSTPVALAVVLLGAGLLTGSEYLDIHQRVSTLEVVNRALPGLILLVLWAGAWACANRLTTHEFRFRSHLVLAFGAGTAYTLFELVKEYYAFYFSPELSFLLVDLGGTAVILSLLLTAHLSLTSSLARSRRALAGAAVALALVGVAEFDTFSSWGDFSTELEFHAHLKPTRSGQLPAIPAVSFFDRAMRLEQEADELVREEGSQRVGGEGQVR
jgi:pSer/pThr/pTyr-binding forkhead associated (FHA) protein